MGTLKRVADCASDCTPAAASTSNTTTGNKKSKAAVSSVSSVIDVTSKEGGGESNIKENTDEITASGNAIVIARKQDLVLQTSLQALEIFKQQLLMQQV